MTNFELREDARFAQDEKSASLRPARAPRGMDRCDVQKFRRYPNAK
jgi:hypothetical protein